MITNSTFYEDMNSYEVKNSGGTSPHLWGRGGQSGEGTKTSPEQKCSDGVCTSAKKWQGAKCQTCANAGRRLEQTGQV